LYYSVPVGGSTLDFSCVFWCTDLMFSTDCHKVVITTSQLTV